MGAKADRASAVSGKQRSLRCEACGAGNRLSSEALEDGWYRCGHCACLRTFGFEWRRRALATERFQTLAYADRRPGVELRTPDGRIFIHMHGRESLRWLEREILAAIEDARGSDGGEWLACPGCGGPVAPEKSLRDAGGIDCLHCQTGLVQTGGGIAMPPVEIGHRHLESSEPAMPPSRHRAAVLEWSAPAWSHTYPKAAPLNLLGIFLLCAGAVAVAWWGVWATPMLEVVAAAAALGVTIGAAKAFPEALLWIYGAHTFCLEDRALVHSVRLGQRLYKRQTIPLTRLVSLEAEREMHQVGGDESVELASDAIQITARTATNEIEIEVYGAHVQAVVRGVLAEIPARLEALGLQVKRPPPHARTTG